MHSYAKFLKEILSNKRKLEDYEIVAIIEECSALMQHKLPPKLKDLGSFSIPCHIGDTSIDKALCDLGASVSLMPLSICGKLKDVHIPIILGRPFLATTGAIIDVKNGRLTLKVREEEVEFNMNQVLKKHHKVDPCLRANVIDEIAKEEFRKRYPKDPLENYLVQDKRSYAIYYASKTLDDAQVNYVTAEKKFLAMEFDLEIKDKKGAENVFTDHLSRIKLESQDGIEEELPIDEFFSNEKLLVVVDALPWFADFVNYLSCGVLPLDLSYQQRKKFLHDVKFYTWENPLLFKRCNDGLVGRCVPKEEIENILEHCHSLDYGGHFSVDRIVAKVNGEF
ncbi:uncharacterized protein LOC131180602 [Hevea brasiliensis]|uniref:uncharacterized protein LOC131180602 n=1 Tax=Hevea brasiliensis TaxID=3981 RepID=UPI0025FB5A57|nr:uncharacterized protein LOC131180602 [Hevea brasiliensis]